MANTVINDVFVPQVLAEQIAAEMDTRSSNLIRSGAVVQDPMLAAAAAQGKGSKVTIPQYASFTSADTVGSDTDPVPSGSAVTPGILGTNNRTSFEVDVPMLRRVVNFDAMDLARAEANVDPLGDVAAQAAAQIIANQDAIVINSLNGIYLDNAAQTGTGTSDLKANDMTTNTIRTTAATTESTDKERFRREVLLDAVGQWGDYGNQAALIVMHSAVYYQLLKDDSTSFRLESEQGFVNSFMGIPVVLDDRVPVTDQTAAVGSSRIPAIYTTYVLGAGAIGYASIMGSPVYDRNEKAGNGWGQESVIVRRTDLVNPRGISYNRSGASGNGTNAQLAAAASWERQWQRKNVNIAFIRSNVG